MMMKMMRLPQLLVVVSFLCVVCLTHSHELDDPVAIPSAPAALGIPMAPSDIAQKLTGPVASPPAPQAKKPEADAINLAAKAKATPPSTPSKPTPPPPSPAATADAKNKKPAKKTEPATDKKKKVGTAGGPPLPKQKKMKLNPLAAISAEASKIMQTLSQVPAATAGKNASASLASTLNKKIMNSLSANARLLQRNVGSLSARAKGRSRSRSKGKKGGKKKGKKGGKKKGKKGGKKKGKKGGKKKGKKGGKKKGKKGGKKKGKKGGKKKGKKGGKKKGKKGGKKKGKKGGKKKGRKRRRRRGSKRRRRRRRRSSSSAHRNKVKRMLHRLKRRLATQAKLHKLSSKVKGNKLRWANKLARLKHTVAKRERALRGRKRAKWDRLMAKLNAMKKGVGSKKIGKVSARTTNNGAFGGSKMRTNSRIYTSGAGSTKKGTGGQVNGKGPENIYNIMQPDSMAASPLKGVYVNVNHKTKVGKKF